MRLTIQTWPDIANAMATVASYAHAPKSVYLRVAIDVSEYVGSTSGYGTTFQKGTRGGIQLETFA